MQDLKRIERDGCFLQVAVLFDQAAETAAWHLFHKDLEDAVLTNGAKVTDDSAMRETRVQPDLFVQRLSFSGKENPKIEKLNFNNYLS